MDLVKVLAEQQIKNDLPELKVGATVKVHQKIKEGNRERIQIFEGTIIAIKHTGINKSVTVRRISYGVGVEKTFPVHSPNIAKFEIVRNGKVRRAKLYYLRGSLYSGTTKERTVVFSPFSLKNWENSGDLRVFCRKLLAIRGGIGII